MNDKKPFLQYLDKCIRTAVIALFLLMVTSAVRSQVVMDEGFAMLESQQYQQAAIFFQDVLDSDPDNKTARICLGRARGLGGNPEDAIVIFDGLLVDYPGNLEVL